MAPMSAAQEGATGPKRNRSPSGLLLVVKLDEIITQLDGPRDEVAGVESKTHEEIEELRKTEIEAL